MKRFLSLFVSCAILTAPIIAPVCLASHAAKTTSHTKSSIRFKGGDGSSKEKAIIILGAANSEQGVPAEYKYLDKKYPGYIATAQKLVHDEETGKVYDVIYLSTKKGEKITVYFDISGFFGKE